MTDNNNNNIPELRFPGFEGEWKETVLSDILRERNEQFPETEEYPLMAFIANVGVAPKGDRYDRGALVKDAKSKKYKRTQLGDFIYSSNNLESGSIGQNNYGNASISPVYSIFEINKKFDSTFIGTLLTKKEFISKMVQYRQGVVYGQWKIHESEFLKLQILAPTLAEQQKIAECLSSLDEEIAAEAQKVDALKDHKKGLMQQLFPAISNEQLAMSNCVPQLRFPGFEGEWVVKKLGTVGNVCMCKRILKDETNSQQGIPFYKIGTFGSIADSYISEELYLRYREKYNFPKKGDILISAAGTIGRTVVYDGKPAYFQDSNIVWINNNEKDVLNCFLRYIYSNIKWKTDNGGIVLRLYNESIRSQDIIIPPTLAEQQKIADCLSELDEMISAQQQKVEALKEHKKGLMQKLFPKMSNEQLAMSN